MGAVAATSCVKWLAASLMAAFLTACDIGCPPQSSSLGNWFLLGVLLAVFLTARKIGCPPQSSSWEIGSCSVPFLLGDPRSPSERAVPPVAPLSPVSASRVAAPFLYPVRVWGCSGGMWVIRKRKAPTGTCHTAATGARRQRHHQSLVPGCREGCREGRAMYAGSRCRPGSQPLMKTIESAACLVEFFVSRPVKTKAESNRKLPVTIRSPLSLFLSTTTTPSTPPAIM